MDYVLDYFSTLEDPRQSWKVVYPLQEILLVVLCGMIAGADNFVEIERWARRKEGFLRRFLVGNAAHPGQSRFKSLELEFSGIHCSIQLF